MKILLCAVNSKYIHSNLAVHLLRAYALKSAECRRAAEENCQGQIEIAEYTINNYSEDVLADIYRRKPDVLAFSCYIWNWEFIRSLFPDIRKVLPAVDIWLGGPEVSFDPEKVLADYSDITGIMLGEGEAVFNDLAESHYMMAEKRLEDISGICFRDGENIIRTAQRALLNMDDVPFVYDEESINEYRNRIIYYETSRGCPFSCAYCLSSVDKKVRLRSLCIVYDELQFFLDHNVPQVKFVDRTFNVDHEHTMGILNYISAHDNGITNFHFEIAGDILTEDELELMAGMRPGLIQLEIGVQSVNPDTIRSIHRVTDLDKLKKTVSRVNGMKNIHQHLDLIAGLPYEDYASFRHSFNEVYAMEPAQLQLGFLKVLKGAPMEKMTEKYGIIYKNAAPYEVLMTDFMSYDDVLRLKKVEEVVELYYNSHQFSQTVKVLEKAFASAFDMYEKLADFYEQRGYFTNSPARIYRYNVLLEFAGEYDPVHLPLYRELLTYDLYLRENCKSRPDFASDLSLYKEIIRNMKPDRRLHVDAFRYRVFEDSAEKIMAESEKTYLISFDYDRRNPLDNNASVIQLQ